MLSTIKDTVTILSIVATLILGGLKYKSSQEISRLKNNLSSTTTQWTDEKGRLVTEVTELRFTNKELKQISERDSSNLSETQKKLWEAGKLISELNIKDKHAESFNSVDLSVSNDSLVSEVIYNEDMSLKALKPIKTAHLSINFNVVGDTVLVDHKYKAKINTVVSREVDKITKNNNTRFFLARWINPRWKYSAKNVSDDNNAKIDSAIHINFQKKKGNRNG